MKKLIIMLAIVMASQLASAQKTTSVTVPPVVREAFKKLYPSVAYPEWEREGANYEANFEIKDIDHSVLFDEKGNMMEAEEEISVQQLPAATREYIALHYKDQKIDETSKIINGKGVVMYEVEVKGADLLFDENGKFISEEKSH